MALTDLRPSTPADRLVATTVAVEPGPAADPLAWLACLPDGATGVPAWFWEIPDDDTAWVGLGTAAGHGVCGADRFPDAADAAHRLLDRIDHRAPDGAPAPRLAAGFAFDDDGSPGRWAPLGGGQVTLPAVQVLRHRGRTWLTTIDGSAGPLPDQPAPAPATPAAVDPADITPASARDHYRHLIRTALDVIADGQIAKAVPCRSVHVDQRPDLPRLVATLRNTYPACATFCVTDGATVFVGATPERLAAMEAGHLHTAALAGSAPRDPSPAIDAALGQGLLTSPKERTEHQVVVDAVTDALRGLGLNPRHPAAPELLRLHGIQHLHTPVDAAAGPHLGLLDVVGALHPTPAVSGHPVGPSAKLRTRHEQMDRGWFAGPIGWMDADGHGEFRVALRSALIDERGTTLYAGAGVVAGSDPDRELLETDVKLRALLGPVLAAAHPEAGP